MRAEDVMTRTVVTVQSRTSVADAVRLMLEQRISGLPVVNDSGQLVGILTEGDLLRRAETGTERRRPAWLDLVRGRGRQADEYVRAHGRRVDEVMTPDVISVDEATPLDRVVELMEGKRVKRIPVVTDGRLVGVVSRVDLLRVLAKVLSEDAPATHGDAAIREQLLAEIRRNGWCSLSSLTVVVTDGVVCLEGVILSEQERAAIRVAAENIVGVKTVRDHLVYLDPSSAFRYGM